MIRFALSCEKSHDFESWFQSGAAFESLQNSGMVTCPECGSTQITKSIMAPMVQKTDATVAPKSPDPIEKLRDHVESTSDYVGAGFAAEARAMHLGDTPERPIYGEANLNEAKALVSDGVPVLPLPFVPRKRTH